MCFCEARRLTLTLENTEGKASLFWLQPEWRHQNRTMKAVVSHALVTWLLLPTILLTAPFEDIYFYLMRIGVWPMCFASV